MEEDYLWDKTGEDTEIEKLENALKMFRYQEIMPPMIPVNIAIIREKSPSKFFSFFQTRFLLASAFCLAFIFLLAVSVWFQLTELTPKNVVVTEITPSTEFKPIVNQSIEPLKSPKINNAKFIIEKTTSKQPLVKIHKTVQVVRQNKPVTPTQIAKKVNPAEVLTKEELYAYNQLMTALSITSSNLKLVKDKAQGVEN